MVNSPIDPILAAAEALDTSEPIEEGLEARLAEIENSIYFGEDLSNYYKQRRGWVVDGIIEAGKIQMIWGESGAYKSAGLVDLGLHVALGRDWCGHKVKQGKVIYLQAEGDDVETRIGVWCKGHGLTDDHVADFGTYPGMDLFLDTTEGELLAQVCDKLKPVLIIIDTYATTMSGNENDAQDSGRYVRTMKRLARNGAAVTLIHHSGKDTSRGARGSISMWGAMDQVYNWSATNGIVTATNKGKKGKARGLPKNFSQSWKPRSVTLSDELGGAVWLEPTDQVSGRDLNWIVDFVNKNASEASPITLAQLQDEGARYLGKEPSKTALTADLKELIEDGAIKVHSIKAPHGATQYLPGDRKPPNE